MDSLVTFINITLPLSMCPFYVWTHICCLFIIVNIVDISGKTKVCNLHNVALCDQDIPGCKVSVYTLR